MALKDRIAFGMSLPHRSPDTIDMPAVRQVAQRVTVLHLGQVFAQGSIEEIVADERVVAIYLGQAHA